MTGELQIDSAALTGSTLYALLYNTAGQVYDTTGANFEDFVAAQISNYDIALTEQGPGAGYWRGDMPAVAAGMYSFAVRRRVGGAPAITDPTVGAGQEFYWDGTIVRSFAVTDILSDSTPFSGADIDVAISSRGTADPGDAMTLTAGERIATAAVVLTQILEGVHTVGDGLRIMLAALAGKSTGGGTFTNRFRDVADSKNRIDATVTANGDRSAITIDGT